ncbi:hypothetical protein [Qaidamihabitans albus]|uniref:hypothetical protein n=1 Tax=Qaidamihabitans albus TaxID=2795733 RepID=UPI0018F12CF1|nr:hypothetical protein [Qaidamihabitans albus]
MATTSPTRRPFRLGGRARKAFLVVHIMSAGLWFGVDIALGISLATAMLTDAPQVAGVALQAIDVFAIWPMFGASLLCLISGVVLGLGSKYGLLRYWWVAVKFGINVAMSTLIFFALRPGVDEAATIGERLLAGDPTAAVPSDLIFPVVVAPTLLITAYVLSTFKPWGRTRRRPKVARTAQQPRAERAARTPIGV